MKKIISAAVVSAFALGMSAFACAGTLPIEQVNNSLNIGFNENLLNYQEHLPSPSDTESGWMPGFTVGYSYMGNLLGVNNLYLSARNKYNSGSINYKGALQTYNGPIPYDTTDKATTETFGFRFGKGFELASNQMLTPYVGIGYYHWNRHLEGIGGYIEDYHNWYTSVGVKYQYALSNHVVLNTADSFGVVYGGGLRIHDLPGISGTFHTRGFGSTARERISVGADYLFSHNLYGFANISYTHFNYTGAPVDGIPGAYEPFSSTNRFGIGVGVGYSF